MKNVRIENEGVLGTPSKERRLRLSVVFKRTKPIRPVCICFIFLPRICNNSVRFHRYKCRTVTRYKYKRIKDFSLPRKKKKDQRLQNHRFVTVAPSRFRAEEKQQRPPARILARRFASACAKSTLAPLSAAVCGLSVCATPRYRPNIYDPCAAFQPLGTWQQPAAHFVCLNL